MDVEIQNEELLSQIEQAIRDSGYRIGAAKQTTESEKINWKNVVLSLIIVAIIAAIFSQIDVSKFLPSIGDKLSLGVALLMGIIASVSTCLAIVGSIVIGFSEFADTNQGTRQHVKTQLSFHAGRVGGFFLLGGIL